MNGCSSSYLACSSSHQRPRGPIFSFWRAPAVLFPRFSGRRPRRRNWSPKPLARIPHCGTCRQVCMEFLDLGVHRLGLLEPLLVYVEPVAHGTPHRVVPALHPDVVGEELPPHRGRAIQQHLQPLRKVANDGIESDQEVLDLPVHQLILGRVDDNGRIEDRLTARFQGCIEIRDPGRVRGHLHCHCSSSPGAGVGTMVQASVQCTGERRTCKLKSDGDLAHIPKITHLTRYIVTEYRDVTSDQRQ